MHAEEWIAFNKMTEAAKDTLDLKVKAGIVQAPIEELKSSSQSLLKGVHDMAGAMAASANLAQVQPGLRALQKALLRVFLQSVRSSRGRSHSACRT